MNKRERSERVIDVGRMYASCALSVKPEFDYAEADRNQLANDFIGDKRNADDMRVHLIVYATSLERLAEKAALIARGIRAEIGGICGQVGTKVGIKEEDDE